MPTYIYKARDTTGKLVKGAMDAATKEELIDKLHKMGYMTTKITESLPGVQLETIFDKLAKVSTQDLIIFYAQLSNLVDAGINILSVLDTLANQIENKKLKEAVSSIRRNVEAGESFSTALARHPRIFPNLFVNLAINRIMGSNHLNSFLFYKNILEKGD